jgi:hypothetical protein
LEAEYEALYKSADPPGDVIPVLVAPFDVDDLTPSAEEIEDTVRILKTGNVPGPSGIKLEHLKDWLAAFDREADPEPYKWDTFVELVQHALQGICPLSCRGQCWR